jgi:hypothetical protein
MSIREIGIPILGVVVPICGWFVVHWLGIKREQKAGASKWRCEFVGVASSLRTEIARGEIPSGWYPSCECSIVQLKRLASTPPTGVARRKREEIDAIVDGLCGMTDIEAINGSRHVVEMLEKLEGLANDT